MLLKRSFGFIIDVLIFILLCEVSFFIYKFSNIDPPNHLSIFTAYLIGFFIPIILFGNTYSGLLLKIKIYKSRNISLKISLLLKSGIYFGVMFGVFSATAVILENLFKYYTNLKIERFVFLYFTITFFISNALVFFISLGKYNLIDYILKIKYTRYQKRNYALDYKIAMLGSSIYLILTFISFKYNLGDYISLINKEVKQKFILEYFPKDDLGNFTASDWIISKTEKTNKVVSLGVPSSLVYNDYLLQKTILTTINKKSFDNISLRKIFCKKLIYYSNRYNYSNNISPDQTQIILFYRERKSFFIYYTGILKYFYEDKMGSIGVTGGVDKNNLQEYYQTTEANYIKQFYTAVGKALEIPTDTMLKYIDEEGNISFPNWIQEKITANGKKKIPFDFKADPPNPKIIKFEDVQPYEWVNVSTPSEEQITYNLFGFDSYDVDEDIFYTYKQTYIFGRP